jgi:hypothetical protein
MEYRNYFGYKVFENGLVYNSSGDALKPQKKNTWYFFELQILGKTKRIGWANLILFSFGKYPLTLKQKAKHIDGNKLNNQLKNLTW